MIRQRRIISLDEDMTGHHNQPRFDRPDMEVMDVLHAGDRFDGRSHM